MALDSGAGRYVKRPRGYRAFIPAPLPPDHHWTLTPRSSRWPLALFRRTCARLL